jgi:hypothetical protein
MYIYIYGSGQVLYQASVCLIRISKWLPFVRTWTHPPVNDYPSWGHELILQFMCSSSCYFPVLYFLLCFVSLRSVLCPMLSVSPEFASSFKLSDSWSTFCPIMCHYILSSVLWCPLWFPHKNVDSSLPPVVLMKVHVLLCYLYVFVYSAFQYCVLLWVLTFVVPCCDVHYNIGIK